MTDPDDLPDDLRDDEDPIDLVLQEMLSDAERTVARLRHELAARRHAARQETTAAQHAEIDRLAEHLDRARIHWSEVRAFFDEALGSLRHPDEHAEPSTQHQDRPR